ncbi:MAG: squalene/phytoene synthase family protein, partial [Arenimonas sp.]|uniref:squalene/phytoene synthase family protein n=1 Tax=Arenimonas sp. TaxID=1872635 RepID=UPI0025BAC651
MNGIALAPASQAGTVEAARSVLRTHGRTFHLASRLLGARHASGAAVLYGFCRHVDDLADESADSRGAVGPRGRGGLRPRPGPPP